MIADGLTRWWHNKYLSNRNFTIHTTRLHLCFTILQVSPRFRMLAHTPLLLWTFFPPARLCLSLSLSVHMEIEYKINFVTASLYLYFVRCMRCIAVVVVCDLPVGSVFMYTGHEIEWSTFLCPWLHGWWKWWDMECDFSSITWLTHVVKGM